MSRSAALCKRPRRAGARASQHRTAQLSGHAANGRCQGLGLGRGGSACALALPTSTCCKDQPEATETKETAEGMGQRAETYEEAGQSPPRRPPSSGETGLMWTDVPWLRCVRRPFMWEVLLPETQTPGPT